MQHEQSEIYFGRHSQADGIAYMAFIYHEGTEYGADADETYVFTPRFVDLESADQWFDEQQTASGNVFTMEQTPEEKRLCFEQLLNWLRERYL
jgi:hypothetical protein